MKNFTLIVVTWLMSVGFAKAQQDAQFSQYMFNQLYLNPATAGINPTNIEVSVIHRSQWLGYSPSFDDGGAPTSQVASVSLPLTKYNLGLGLHLVNDQLGPVTNQEVQFSLAYQLKLKSGVVSLGARGGLFNNTIDFEQLRFVDPDDPFIRAGSENQLKPDFGAGIFYKPNNDKFYVGASINHLNQSEFDFGTDISSNALENHVSAIAGINVDLTRNVLLSPSIIMKSDMNTFSFEASAIATVNQKFYGGISFREVEAAILLLGVHLMKDKRLRVGYAIDYTIEAQNAKETTSHEVLLTYKLPAFTPFEPSIIRTPRFRHD